MLSLRPKSSLIDKITKIHVTRLKPQQKITLEARVVGDQGEVFASHAHFIADKDGEVDVCRDSSLGGSYSGVSPMGLLWSMKLAPGQRKGIALMKSDVTTPYNIELKCFDDHISLNGAPSQPSMSSVTFQKWYMADGVRRIPVRKGRIRGTLFLPPGDGPFPGVIDLFGGAGGLVEFKASLLASHGFAALALAYFAYDDLPSSPEYINLEYIEEAAEWLYYHPKVLPNGIAIISYCLGSWVGLLLASYRTDLIKATVAISPWHAAFWMPYKYKGKLSNVFLYSSEDMKITDEGVILRYCTRPANEFALASGDMSAVTPVERITCPVLLVYGTDDLNIDSDFTVGYISERLKAVGKGSLCTVMQFPGAGHRIEPPYTPLCHVSYMKPFKQYWVLGGEPESHALAQEISWQKILDFLQLNLTNVKSSL
ncbi:hypothetical protein ACROYT_G038494 [Oculina patagonica]